MTFARDLKGTFVTGAAWFQASSLDMHSERGAVPRVHFESPLEKQGEQFDLGMGFPLTCLYGYP